MFKKLILGALFTGLIALLVIGGIRRTQDKLAQAAETAVGQQNNKNDSAHETNADHEEVGTPVSDWQTITATVTDARPNGLWLQLANGQTVRLRRQPWVFAQTQGFGAQVGDTVRLTGYDNAGNFEVCTAENLTSGQMAQVRDENGRSLWSEHD